MDPLTIPQRSASNDVELQTPERPAPRREEESFIVEIFKFSILALIIVVPFRLFVAQPFLVNGASMSPTFETGQYLIVDQLTYHLEQPERGDVVIFRFPNDPSKFFIKRIIGLPGEEVRLHDGTTTIVDPGTSAERPLDEPYVKTGLTDDDLTVTLSADEYFVMGDNRGASSDSRVWGPVPRRNIVGRALLRLLPPRTFGLFPGATKTAGTAETF